MRILGQRLLVALSVSVLASCSSMPTSSSSAIEEFDGRITIADVHIGESYDTVLVNADTQYGVEPHCEGRRVALGVQRKAFLYDACAYTPTKATYAGAPLSEVVFHFIDRSLVRVDVRAAGESALLETIKADMQHFFADRGASVQEVGKGNYQWVDGDKVASVREGTSASRGNVYVRMLDRTLASDAPWLVVH